MYVGHYGPSLALKAMVKNASLGWLFIAGQMLDIIFFPLVLLGVERLVIVPHYTASTSFELPYMPYSHSLVAAVIWSALAYAGVRWWQRGKSGRGRAVALAIGAGVFSHWLCDLLVHTPDLPLWSNSSPKVGLGLWNDVITAFLLESAFLIVPAWFYMRGTRAKDNLGRYGLPVFIAVLIVVNAINTFVPPPIETATPFAVSALVSYALFTAVAFWLDRKREPIAARD